MHFFQTLWICVAMVAIVTKAESRYRNRNNSSLSSLPLLSHAPSSGFWPGWGWSLSSSRPYPFSTPRWPCLTLASLVMVCPSLMNLLLLQWLCLWLDAHMPGNCNYICNLIVLVNLTLNISNNKLTKYASVQLLNVYIVVLEVNRPQPYRLD